MANEILVKVGTQILFGDHAGDYVGGTGNNKLEIGTPTDVQIACASLAAGAARQSAKVDLGGGKGPNVFSNDEFRDGYRPGCWR